MAGLQKTEAVNTETEKKKLQEEKKRLKEERKQQKKEARKRAKEITMQEAELSEEDEGGGFSVFLLTAFIVIIWIAILCAVVKLDVGGLGTNVLTPILKDVPVLKYILPGDKITETEDAGAYGGYTSLKEAVEQIKKLEVEAEAAKTSALAREEDIKALKAEIVRLKEFEKMQVEFQRLKTEFFEEVIYADKGPGAEEYIKYYEAMDPTTAAYLYKQAVIEREESEEIRNYAKAYSEMKPKEAAAIIEEMTDNLKLAARILGVMNAEDRGKILGVMDPKVAAKLTKIMDPES